MKTLLSGFKDVMTQHQREDLNNLIRYYEILREKVVEEDVKRNVEKDVERGVKRDVKKNNEKD